MVSPKNFKIVWKY